MTKLLVALLTLRLPWVQASELNLVSRFSERRCTSKFLGQFLRLKLGTLIRERLRLEIKTITVLTYLTTSITMSTVCAWIV